VTGRHAASGKKDGPLKGFLLNGNRKDLEKLSNKIGNDESSNYFPSGILYSRKEIDHAKLSRTLI
jgi:antitoxin component YwqK of YwqJK toxin-antitoxin module